MLTDRLILIGLPSVAFIDRSSLSPPNSLNGPGYLYLDWRAASRFWRMPGLLRLMVLSLTKPPFELAGLPPNSLWKSSYICMVTLIWKIPHRSRKRWISISSGLASSSMCTWFTD